MTKEKRGRVSWTLEEQEALVQGFQKHGPQWRRILDDFKGIFNACRTNVHLKDKWRNLVKNGIVDESNPGEYLEREEVKNYYGILGIERSATEKMLKRAYHAAALRWHPDKNKEHGSAEKFAEIKEAYRILSDKGKRLAYDKKLTSYRPLQVKRKSTTFSKPHPKKHKSSPQAGKKETKTLLDTQTPQKVASQEDANSQDSDDATIEPQLSQASEDDFKVLDSRNIKEDGENQPPAQTHAKDSPEDWTKSALRKFILQNGYTEEIPDQRHMLLRIAQRFWDRKQLKKDLGGGVSEDTPALSQNKIKRNPSDLLSVDSDRSEKIIIANRTRNGQRVFSAEKKHASKQARQDKAKSSIKPKVSRPLVSNAANSNDSETDVDIDPFCAAWDGFVAKHKGKLLKDRHRKLCEGFFDHLIEVKLVRFTSASPDES